MNQPQEITVSQAIANANQAIQAGDDQLALQWAGHAASLAPDQEEPWLLLASLSKPRASLEYARRALAINPGSERAQREFALAVERARAQEAQPPKPVAKYHLPGATAGIRRKWFTFPLLAALLLFAVAMVVWGPVPEVSAMINLPTATEVVVAAARANPLTPTPTPTFTLTPTPTSTPTSTPTRTPRPTRTPTNTPYPTRIPLPTKPPAAPPPSTDVGPNQRWVEVDLSEQKVYAYKGTKLLKTFTVSTGLPNTPTVVGEFQIYIKLKSQDMAGYGYYLPDVPYVMYFYKDYALHGTYWHNNFGTPMSHGCVNMRTADAKWMFDFADYGTLVVVHY